MLMYAVGRRYGAEWVQRKMRRFVGAGRQERLELLYARRGTLALFLSRFLPGVRAIVPPFAGAVRVPAVRAGVAMAVASGIWYGAITLIAFRVGADWSRLQRIIGTLSRDAAIGAGAVVVLGVGAWYVLRRRRRAAA